MRLDDPASLAVAPLLAEHLAEQHGAVPAGFAFALDARALAGPGIDFLTAWDGDTLTGFGALKRLGDGTGEVKSMRAAPAHRGRGTGRALLDRIVAIARAEGLTRLLLETGTTAAYAPALALYRSAGFVACPPFADYVASPHNQFLSLDLRES